MKRGYLSEYFEGAAMKDLSAVEADRTRSHQHEYNATSAMLAFMGRPADRTRIETCFIYLNDDQDDPAIENAFLTLYNSRENQPHRSAEYRFYFPTTRVSQLAAEGDRLLIAKRRDGRLLVVIASAGSSAARQIEWLFGFSEEALPRFSARSELEEERDRVGFSAALILESIGIEVNTASDDHLEEMLSRFGGSFPRTSDFSAFAREIAGNVDPRDDPDAALMTWMEKEESLFRTLERHVIGGRLAQGFSATQIDDFISFSLSVQNRRKSRVGLALENHTQALLNSLGIRFTRAAVTEGKSKPDFLLPGRHEYHDPTFRTDCLSMLAVKSTCKDRWRQVLTEADRIEIKHLLTLETAISEGQIREMQSRRLQLVVPRALHLTYTESQRAWLSDIRNFGELALERQTLSQ